MCQRPLREHRQPSGGHRHAAKRRKQAKTFVFKITFKVVLYTATPKMAVQSRAPASASDGSVPARVSGAMLVSGRTPTTTTTRLRRGRLRAAARSARFCSPTPRREERRAAVRRLTARPNEGLTRGMTANGAWVAYRERSGVDTLVTFWPRGQGISGGARGVEGGSAILPERRHRRSTARPCERVSGGARAGVGRVGLRENV
jgi:hypothetical protein